LRNTEPFIKNLTLARKKYIERKTNNKMGITKKQDTGSHRAKAGSTILVFTSIDTYITEEKGTIKLNNK
jgi:hypothetical protein